MDIHPKEIDTLLALYVADMNGVIHIRQKNDNGEKNDNEGAAGGAPPAKPFLLGPNGIKIYGGVRNNPPSNGRSSVNNNQTGVAANEDIKFGKTEDDPAPNGTECVMYLARKVSCVAKKGSKENRISSFHGELAGVNEPFRLKFNLKRNAERDHFGLIITDEARPFEGRMSLARFQQAELLLQFLNPQQGAESVVHEEPAFKVSIDLPHEEWKKQSRSGQGLSKRAKCFSVFCKNVIPASKVPVAVQKQGDNFILVIRVYFKLIQGELDVLHGIQKCFHPDKALYDIRDVMAQSLVDAEESDVILVSGDNVGYRAHRSILSANSLVFRAMFLSGLQESKSGIMRTPPFVSGDVLETFLKFLYARNRKDLEHDPFLTMSVLQFADIYDMSLLVEACEESLLAMPVDRFSLQSCLFVFRLAGLLGKFAIETKIVHVLMRMDVKLTSSKAYLEFIQEVPEMAARMTEMIVQFQTADLKKLITDGMMGKV